MKALFKPLFAAFAALILSLSGCSDKGNPTVISVGGKAVVITDSSAVDKAENPWQVILKKKGRIVRLSTQLPQTTPEQFKSYLEERGVVVDEYKRMGGSNYDFLVTISKDTTIDLKNKGVLTLGGGGVSWQSPDA